jgi:DNA-damage-inducible protein J
MSMTVAMDDALKADFAAVRAEIGMSASTAVNVFAKKVVRERRIPFELSARPEAPIAREVQAYERMLAAELLEGYVEAEAGRTRTFDELRAARALRTEGNADA